MSIFIINKPVLNRNPTHRVPPAHYIPPILTSHRSGFKYPRDLLRGEESNDYAITWSSDSERSFVGR